MYAYFFCCSLVGDDTYNRRFQMSSASMGTGHRNQGFNKPLSHSEESCPYTTSEEIMFYRLEIFRLNLFLFSLYKAGSIYFSLAIFPVQTHPIMVRILV